jgi:hypothetical protein
MNSAWLIPVSTPEDANGSDESGGVDADTINNNWLKY